MLVDELPLIVQPYPWIVGLQLLEGGEDEVLPRAVGVLEVLANHLGLVLIINKTDFAKKISRQNSVKHIIYLLGMSDLTDHKIKQISAYPTIFHILNFSTSIKILHLDV